MKIGFTGSRHGMTSKQMVEVRRLLCRPFTEFHYGGCVGADAEAAQIAANRPGAKLVLHPPSNSTMLAEVSLASHEMRPAKPYLQRNRDIVDETDMLIAAPHGMTEELRSGTWATIRYARKLKRPITICWPDGFVTGENQDGDAKPS
jgi:predicted Rossmann fold nucleotide-binding protein DprA/Smf involved in DNA uptake